MVFSSLEFIFQFLPIFLLIYFLCPARYKNFCLFAGSMISTFTGMMQGKGVSAVSFINIPVSILLGIILGLAAGSLLALFFKQVHIRDTSKVLIILSISLFLVAAEDMLATPIRFSSLIAVMFIGIGLQKKRGEAARRISVKYGKLWVAAEIFLFVLVGAAVNTGYLAQAGGQALLVILGALAFRMAGVAFCLWGTKLGRRERLFVMLAYTPKATVQAAIGGIPLSMGLACGDTVLTAAVLAIVLTCAPGGVCDGSVVSEASEQVMTVFHIRRCGSR